MRDSWDWYEKFVLVTIPINSLLMGFHFYMYKYENDITSFYILFVGAVGIFFGIIGVIWKLKQA